MPFGRIVVGIDFSGASLAAARWVATQLAPRAEIVLVHVLPEPEAAPFVRPHLPPMLDVMSDVVPALYGGLRGVADLTGADRTRIDIYTGAPADALALASAEYEADLVCLGRTRSRRGSARFGATTAQRLLTRTRVPVLVVPATRPAAPPRILAALDGRPAGRAAAEMAWRLAGAGSGRVEAVHVLGPELRGFVRACGATAREGGCAARPHLALERAEAARIRDEAHLFGLTAQWIARELEAIGAPGTRAAAHVRVGDPGQEIVAFARATGIGIIVIGRGEDGAIPTTAAGRVPVGSTARLVTWVAPAPVLVLSPASTTSDADRSPRGATWRRQVAPARADRVAALGGADPHPPAAAAPRTAGRAGPRGVTITPGA